MLPASGVEAGQNRHWPTSIKGMQLICRFAEWLDF